MAPMQGHDEAQREMIVVRHGERCDFVFNHVGQKSWVRRAFDANGRYTPFDINLPRNVPRRKDGWEAFESDTPLTEMGYLQSKLIGRAMRDQGIHIDFIYCSSSLRCIQTAVGILKGLGLGSSNTRVEMHIEPGLFEWMQWCRGRRPSWMDRDDLLKMGYPINMSYKPLYPENELRMDETYVDYYHRSHNVIQNILRRHPKGTALVVGHSATLEVCTRQLVGGEIRSCDDFYTILRNTSYLGAVRVVKHPRRGWELAGSPVPSLTHSSNTTFDPTILEMESKQFRERAAKDPKFLL